jgi:perosamine synthetase
MKTIRSDYIPFGKPNFSAAEVDAVTRVLTTGWIGMGPETLAFENELAEFVGAPYVISVNSCTSALFLALLVHGVGPGDEVICPSLTWCASANAALYLGAGVAFCDVDPDTMCVTLDSIREKLTSRTKAVVVVHYGGFAVDVQRIRDGLPSHVVILEDAAHALGGYWPGGKKVGASGNPTCFSFYGNKNLAAGEGGAIALFDAEKTERLCCLRQHGLPVDAWKRFSEPTHLPRATVAELGYKMNYTDLQASLARVQLRRQPEFHAIRLAIARYYSERLINEAPSVGFQKDVVETSHARHLFVVRLPVEELSMSRNGFLVEMRRRNIGASIHYPPLHGMELYSKIARQPPLPAVEKLYREILTLPISASMTMDHAEYVMDHFLEVLQGATIQRFGGEEAACGCRT